MKKAYIVRLVDGDNDILIKLIDQETWDWINLDKSGQPASKKVKNFIGFTKNEEINRWDDTLCPESIRERIKQKYESDGNIFDGVWITAGTWYNDRAIYAPVLEDDYDTFYSYYSNTKKIRKMIKTAEERGYEVDFDDQYDGVMY